MKEHYDVEETQNITFGGNKPLMSTYPFEKVLADARYFKGKYKIDSLQGDMMNIAFYQGEEPELYKGEVTTWTYYDESLQVKIVDKYTLFVKGLNITYFLVQIQR